MNSKSERRLVYGILGCALGLMVLGFITISNTFCVDASMFSGKKWQVILDDLQVKKNNSAVKSVVNKYDKYDVSVLLKSYGEETSFDIAIDNTGDLDAILSEGTLLSYNDYTIGVSDLTGEEYHLSDYIDYRITYVSDNSANNIKKNETPRVGDTLKSNTRNMVNIEIRYKDVSNLTEDQLYVLTNELAKTEIDGHEYWALKVELEIEFNYEEL